MQRRTLYPLLGCLLALGSPGGLLLVRAAAVAAWPSPFWAAREIGAQPLVYIYLSASSALVFALIGFLLGRQEDLLLSLSTTDPLTGLFNRRFLQTEIERELARASRYSVPLAMLLVDVDRLKAINDRLGHHAGDRALISVSAAIHQNLRIHDMAARYGGDEFAVLCPHTDGREALALAERIREAVQRSTQGMALSVSIGIQAVEGPAVPAPDRLIAGADRALYAAKEGGRNRTCSSSEAPRPA